MTPESDPELFRSFGTAVRKRELGAQSGWSLAHMASVYARLGDGDAALHCLDVLARSCLTADLFTVHNDWRRMGVSMDMEAAPIQLAANLGWTNAVQEMLLQAAPTTVKLLPAVPARWRKGRFEGWRFCTGLAGADWDRDRGLFRAELFAERPTGLLLKLPDGRESCSLAGEGACWTSSPLGDAYRSVEIAPGARLTIQGKAQPI